MTEFTIVDVAEMPYIYAERSCSMDPGEISQAMGDAFGQVMGVVKAHDIQPAGPPMSVYLTYDPNTLTFRAGMPIAKADMSKASGGVAADVVPAGRALHFVHTGPYAKLRDTYGLAMQHLQANSLEMRAPTWEVYIDDPAETPEAELRTNCFMMLS